MELDVVGGRIAIQIDGPAEQNPTIEGERHLEEEKEHVGIPNMETTWFVNFINSIFLETI